MNTDEELIPNLKYKQKAAEIVARCNYQGPCKVNGKLEDPRKFCHRCSRYIHHPSHDTWNDKDAAFLVDFTAMTPFSELVNEIRSRISNHKDAVHVGRNKGLTAAIEVIERWENNTGILQHKNKVVDEYELVLRARKQIQDALTTTHDEKQEAGRNFLSLLRRVARIASEERGGSNEEWSQDEMLDVLEWVKIELDEERERAEGRSENES